MDINSSFLDVDDTILTKKLLLPENVHERDKLAAQFDTKPFLIVQPTPGSCIKTKTTDSGEKIFLNICTADKIPAPKDISDAELFEILSEESPSFSIPMSIGSERLESDKGGSPCITYDVMINTRYYDKCQKNKNFWLFTISVIMDGVSNKFGKPLNTEEFVVLKNRKVMGKLQQHRIENREPRGINQPQVQKPLIEEIASLTENKCEKRDDSKFDYVLLKHPSKGATTYLIGLFQMPKGITANDVAVLLDSDRVIVAVDKASLTYDLSFLYTVKPDNAKCFFDKDMRVLRINMPVESDVIDGSTNK